jgi:RNA polymerase subunit RPABC4/transcription elongation factor Spt4
MTDEFQCPYCKEKFHEEYTCCPKCGKRIYDRSIPIINEILHTGNAKACPECGYVTEDPSWNYCPHDGDSLYEIPNRFI